jgi:hypothetical protein
MYRKLIGAFVGLAMMGMAGTANAIIIEFGFAGEMTSSDADFSVGDTFVGSYSFESTTSPIAHPDGSLTFQYLTGTATWNVSFITKGYVFSGVGTNISVGNDTVAFGNDRYISTMSSPTSVGTPLPSGRTLSFFQIDLFDPASGGADLLSDDTIQISPPDILLAGSISGRFRFSNNDQPFYILTELTAAPEPSTLALFATGLALLAFMGWRRRWVV